MVGIYQMSRRRFRLALCRPIPSRIRHHRILLANLRMKHWKSLLRYLDNRLRDALLAAAEARSRQDWSAAERHYEAALERDPGQPVVILQLGHAQREMGRLQDAEATYRRAIAVRPGYPQGYLYLGHTLKAQGHSSAAVDAYARALETNPGFRAAREELIAAGARDRPPEFA